MRVFIAVPLPPDVKGNILAVQQEFQRLPVQAAWVRESGLHLTLKFLGEVDAKDIEPIASCMVETSRGYHPFSLAVSGMGVFPHDSRPRVLWAGIQDGTGQLTHLQKALETRLAQSGFPAEGRSFTPHLTLARVKSIQRREDFVACVRGHREDSFGRLNVHQLELIESQLHPSGARYSTIKAVYLPPIAGDLSL